MTFHVKYVHLLKSFHIDDNLTPQDVKQLIDLILGLSDIFALDQSGLSSTYVVTHDIDTGDSIPIEQYPRHLFCSSQ